MYAWFGFAGSTEMLEIGRPGEFAASVSRRVNVTALAGSASALLEMNTRPRVVAAVLGTSDVRRGLRNIRPKTVAPPAHQTRQMQVRGRPPGSKNTTVATHHDVGKPPNATRPSKTDSSTRIKDQA